MKVLILGGSSDIGLEVTKQLLDLTTLSAIGIVFGNIIIGLIVGYLDQIFYGFFVV